MWFEKLTGFKEESPDFVRKNLKIEGDYFISKSTNQKLKFGKLEIGTLENLRTKSPNLDTFNDKINVEELVANVEELHKDKKNEAALFQAASQFNLLEMIGPHITPNQGIDRYEHDHTQGPACAIACGAGTIYRNYFVPMNEHIGQSATHQIDCLDLIGQELGNDKLAYWQMQNGYAIASQKGLLAINKKLSLLNDKQRENLKDLLKVGIQWETEVTISESKHTVSQIYCSALPVAYCNTEQYHWEHFAKIILEAAYEATLYAALINLDKSKKVYLTLLGGGAFGNHPSWVLGSLKQALIKFKNTPLEVYVVSYGSSNKQVIDYLAELIM